MINIFQQLSADTTNNVGTSSALYCRLLQYFQLPVGLFLLIYLSFIFITHIIIKNQIQQNMDSKMITQGDEKQILLEDNGPTESIGLIQEDQGSRQGGFGDIILNTSEDHDLNISNIQCFHYGLEDPSLCSMNSQFGFNFTSRNQYFFNQNVSNDIDQEQIPVQNIGESKNIPKNVGKVLIKFLTQNKRFIVKFLKSINSKAKHKNMVELIKERNEKMIKIEDLQSLWVDSSEYGRQMRIISNFFLRKCGPNWIYNSRVQLRKVHLKYRKILLEEIKKPQQFVSLKKGIY